MEIMRAANIEEAVARATQLKQDGQYNWFRGQLREWEPGSSLERRLHENPNAKIQFEEKLNRFLVWVKAQPALAYLAEPEHVDALFAVLQHYGFPTLYIDFTTEPAVAGFFASDTKSPPEEPGNSVIYCLNTAKLVEFYDTLRQRNSHFSALLVEPVVVDVPNLWRLQSQHGCFLFANHEWYLNYYMDRIVFPWSGTPAFPSRDQIYPAHKSALEQLLDQYFFNERRIENDAALRAMAKAAGKESFFTHFEMEPSNNEQESFLTPPTPTEHWSSDALKDWFKTPTEHFDSTVGRRISIPLRSGDVAPDFAYQVQQSIKSALSLQPKLRAEAVEWIFTGLPNNVNEPRFVSSTRAAWNGMRNLPYTNDDIAATISALATLCSLSDCQSLDGQTVDRAFASWIPDAVHVEIGNQDGSYSRAYCSNGGLLEALDHGWKTNLQNSEPLDSISSAFSYTYDPRLMFDFKRLSWIFAREVIPSQLAMNRPVVLFNPADLDSFGLP